MTSSEVLHGFSSSIIKIAKSIRGSNIAFVIDASDSVPKVLELIKAFTIELINIRRDIGSYSFNIISFSDTYSKLSNGMVPCNKSTSMLASRWIHTLNCDTSTNTLLALGTAYTDNLVDAVVMLTDGLLNQKSPDVIKCVSELSQGRPLHIMYINEENTDITVIPFLETLAISTNGTLHVIKHESKYVLAEEQIYPHNNTDINESYKTYNSTAINVSYNSTNTSSSLSSSSEPCDTEEEKSEDVEIKLLGKVVLAKRYKNGYFYKGTIIKLTSLSDNVVVLFQPSKDKLSQLQQVCSLHDLIFYDDVKEDKIYTDDKVLVKFEQKNRFIPGTVISKEYIFDDGLKDDVHFTKMIEVQLFNSDTKNIPISSAVHITLDWYDKIVKGIRDAEENNVKNHNLSKKTDASKQYNEEEINETISDSFCDISKDLLRDKIERQLYESEEFLRSLNAKTNADPLSKEEIYSSNNNSVQDILSAKPKILSRRIYDDDVRPALLPNKKESPTSNYKNEPHPPISWNISCHNSKKSKRMNCTYPRALPKSGSIGSNVVEMSMKHWKGRPISKESSPKRPFNERYSTILTSRAPKAEEYQTTDGVPFPIKTDNRLKKAKNYSWTPDANDAGDYLHHDIIAHRLVDLSKPNEIFNKYEHENQEVKKYSPKKTNQKLQERELEVNTKKQKQLEQRNKNVRQQIEDRINQEFSKIRIRIEKDEAIQKNKQQKQEQQCKYEREREEKKQERKHDRIEALKERRKNYQLLENKRAEAQTEKKIIFDRSNCSREARQDAFERHRIQKQIQDHESKINRLKDLRKSTESRFRSMRKENDRNREISHYVKDQQTGILRAGILP